MPGEVHLCPCIGPLPLNGKYLAFTKFIVKNRRARTQARRRITA